MNKYNKSTLMGYKKDYLADLVLAEARNVGAMEETLNQQAENVKDWQPVIHSKWVNSYEDDILCETGYKCENCNEAFTIEIGLTPKDVGLFYCPNCGAKMDGK